MPRAFPFFLHVSGGDTRVAPRIRYATLAEFSILRFPLKVNGQFFSPCRRIGFFEQVDPRDGELHRYRDPVDDVDALEAAVTDRLHQL